MRRIRYALYRLHACQAALLKRTCITTGYYPLPPAPSSLQEAGLNIETKLQQSPTAKPPVSHCQDSRRRAGGASTIQA